MKKIFTIFLAIMTLITLTSCENKETLTKQPNQNETVQKQEEITPKKDEVIIVDDEIIEKDDEDNLPPENEKVTVEKIINCDGCVFAYFSDEGDKAKTIGSTLTPSEYTKDIATLKTMGGKQRHNFFGLILNDNKITRAYACILKDNKIYCIEGSDNGAYQQNNIAILNQIFTSNHCKFISDGHTYYCTDGNYNGDTIDTGYASLHYETSCVIYGSRAKTGQLICH